MLPNDDAANQMQTDFLPIAHKRTTVSSIRAELSRQSFAKLAKANEKTPAEAAFEASLEKARENEEKPA